MNEPNNHEALNPADVLRNPQNYDPQTIQLVIQQLNEATLSTLNEIEESNKKIISAALEKAQKEGTSADAKKLAQVRQMLQNND